MNPYELETVLNRLILKVVGGTSCVCVNDTHHFLLDHALHYSSYHCMRFMCIKVILVLYTIRTTLRNNLNGLEYRFKISLSVLENRLKCSLNSLEK